MSQMSDKTDCGEGGSNDGYQKSRVGSAWGSSGCHPGIETLESGGDDFLSKPFHPKELLLRVQKRLKENDQSQKVILEVSNLKMNLNSRQCYVDTREVTLTPKQFEILKLLIENQSQMVSRQTFMSEIWGHFDVTPRNVDSQINYLKKKIDGFTGQIIAVPSYGYRLETK